MESPTWLESWSLHGIAGIRRARGNMEDALELARQAFELDPSQNVFLNSFIAMAAETGSEEAILDAQRILEERAPGNAEALNSFSWGLALTASEDPRLLELAVEMGESALELEPDNADAWNTLGVARYYAGDLEGAVHALLESERLMPEILNWLFLAMARHDLGDDAVARIWYERAVSWLDANAGNDPELLRFREEADALLGGG